MKRTMFFIIMAGVTVGDGAIIGTRAVVTKDVPPYTIVGWVNAENVILKFSKRIERIEIP